MPRQHPTLRIVVHNSSLRPVPPIAQTRGQVGGESLQTGREGPPLLLTVLLGIPVMMVTQGGPAKAVTEGGLLLAPAKYCYL